MNIYGSAKSAGGVGLPTSDISSFCAHHLFHLFKLNLYTLGPTGAALNGHGLANYTGGVYYDQTQSTHHTHAVSITGWGKEAATGQEYWIVRNSWGAYWVVRLIIMKNVFVGGDTVPLFSRSILTSLVVLRNCRNGILSHSNGRKYSRH